AGGRESPHWEAYPTHQFLHTVGMLPCCAEGGCWRSRAVPLGDGDEKDHPNHLCTDLQEHLPRCMHLITSQEVVTKISGYSRGPPGRCLTSGQAEQVSAYLNYRSQIASIPN